MATNTRNTEPTRPLPEPRAGSDGNWHATATLSPKSMTTRARLPVPSSKVIPVIVIPGIMGSNLRANVGAGKKPNEVLKPGEAAWRPPNGVAAGLEEAGKWADRKPATRQKILDPATLEVDPDGAIGVPTRNSGDAAWNPTMLRERGWGEIHSSSYGTLLVTLQTRLNSTFRTVWEKRFPQSHWLYLNKFDRANWGTTKSGLMAELSEAELDKFAEYHYPVYAFGYNWLESNEQSADNLNRRIVAILAEWTAAKKQCHSVILVTHSMGGFVGRACAKQIPEKILGVIHGAMPALGAPVCYRRIACGTESSSPSKGNIGNMAMDKFADIAGRTAADTTAVMAMAAGPLELLPNHLYPAPWLFAEVAMGSAGRHDFLRLPQGSPYDLYRDFKSWYRLINPALADPANHYLGRVSEHIRNAITQAEKFHTQVLGSYYHPNTFAFYGSDRDQLSFGSCRWRTRSTMASADTLLSAKPSNQGDGARKVTIDGGQILLFEHSIQDIAGDGTVPEQSGAGPADKILQLFRTSGYDHQGSYNVEAMLFLTQHLIAKMVQKL